MQVLRLKNRPLLNREHYLTVCSYHVAYAFQSESTLYIGQFGSLVVGSSSVAEKSTLTLRIEMKLYL